MSDRERLIMMTVVYGAVLSGTNTFHGRTGGDLAYLLGAIVEDKKAAFSSRSQIVKILRDNFSPDHKVWSFIEFS
jgi:hypothetical protein